MRGLYLDYPFAVSGDGRARTTDRDDHVRDMIEQVLLTSPGERVNLPEFGCGLSELVFAPMSTTVVAQTQVLVQSNLDRWLGDVITVLSLAVSASEDDSGGERLVIDIVYMRLDTGQRVEDRFTGPKCGH